MDRISIKQFCIKEWKNFKEIDMKIMKNNQEKFDEEEFLKFKIYFRIQKKRNILKI